MLNQEIYFGEYIKISHCRDCTVPGYMIISLQRPAYELSDLSAAESAGLMNGLIFSERALTTRFYPEKIYIMRFSEGHNELHFHIFPRYASLTKLYLAEHNETAIDGPFFFSWARKKLHYSQPILNQEMLAAQSILKETLEVYFSKSLLPL